MAPVRILILCVALVAAVGAAVIMRGMAKSQSKAPVAAAPAAVEKPMAQVLVAKRDLQPGERLIAADVDWQAWPKEAAVGTSYIVKAAAPPAPSQTAKVAATAADIAKAAVGETDPAVAPFLGAVVREAILKGEPMNPRKVVKAGDSGVLAVTLSPGMRAMAVPLSAESAAGGFILPGDHVDVVQSSQADGTGGARRFISSTVLKNVKVLAIDQQTRPAEKGATQIGATATLEVPLDQAEALVQAKAQGELTLVLRSYADIEGPSVKVMPRLADLGVPTTVKVFRSGERSEVQVSR